MSVPRIILKKNSVFKISVSSFCHSAMLQEAGSRVVRALYLKSGDFFKSFSDHQMDWNQIVFGSTPRLRLYVANWSASCPLGSLTGSVHLFYSGAICIVVSHQPMAATYQPTYQIEYYYYYCCCYRYHYYYYDHRNVFSISINTNTNN